MNSFLKVVSEIEGKLAEVYDLAEGYRATDFLSIQATKTSLVPGQVLYLAENDTVFLSIEIREDIMDLLSAKNPFERLDAENLPAFFVLVEEISHFHLLVSRIERDQPVRGIELEWQGEVDKLLLASDLLFEQTASNHFFHLAKILFDQPKFQVAPHLLPAYIEASRLAGRFWYDHFCGLQVSLLPHYGTTLKALYHMSWPLRFFRLSPAQKKQPNQVIFS